MVKIITTIYPPPQLSDNQLVALLILNSRTFGNPHAAVQDTCRTFGNSHAAVQDTCRTFGNSHAAMQDTCRNFGNSHVQSQIKQI